MNCNTKLNGVLFLVLGLLMLNSPIYSQYAKTSPINHLVVGDKVPDINLGDIINYGSTISSNKKKLTIKDFEGKLLILDFWTSSCGSCIAAFPKLKKLQDKFKDQLVILPVAFDPTEGNISVQSLIERWKGTPRELLLPSTHLSRERFDEMRTYFPFQTVPTIIWIDKEGIFKGITEANILNERNISSILIDGQVALRTKVATQSYFDSKKVFLIPTENYIKTNIFGSCLTGFLDSLSDGEGKYLQPDTTIKGAFRFFQVNGSIYSIYGNAYQNVYPEYSWLNCHKLIFVTDSTKKLYPAENKDMFLNDDRKYSYIIDNFYYCYEAILPRKKYSQLQACKYIINDLDEKLNYESRIEKREISCLKLVKLNNLIRPSAFIDTTNLKFKHLSFEESERLFDQRKLSITHENINQFVAGLNYQNIPGLSFVVNGTGYSDCIVAMIVEESFFEDYTSLINGLRKYGLDLVSSKITRDVLVLQKK